MTHIMPRQSATRQDRHHAAPAEAVARGGSALIGLVILVMIIGATAPFGSDLGLLTGVLGSLLAPLVVPQSARHPRLAVIWSALAFAVPVALALSQPAFALVVSLSLGALGLWVMAVLIAYARLPQA